MSHNGSYADEPIGDTATATNNDFGDATTYGDVFVEISTETMQEVECTGIKCYVACSCNTDEGWFDTPAGARNGDTNAEVYTVTSDKHYSLSSVSTSSIDDITISTMSTNANQTPITTASTRSMFTAPSLRTASASSTKATCYKKKTCGDMGYYDEEPSKDYFTSEKSTNECYQVTGCNTDGGAYITSPNTDFFITSSKTSEQNIVTTCYRATGCATGKVSVNPLQASSVIPAMSNYFDIEVSVASGFICVGDNGCNTEKGASTTSPDNTVFNVYEGTIETTCYKATSCKTSNYWVEEADKPNETIFSIVSKPYPSPDSRRCYKANGCQCGILPGDLSSFGLEYEVSGSTKCTLINNSQITALVNQCNSITNNKEAYSGCLGMKAALDSMNKNTGTTQKSVCQNACVTTSTNNANINQNTYINTCYGICTYACGSDSDTCPTGYYDIDPDDYGSLVFSTGITLPSGKECFKPEGCNEGNGYYASSSSINSAIFTSTYSSVLGKKCYYATGCADGYSPSGTGTLYQSGNVKCYRSTCNSSEGYYKTNTECLSAADGLREACVYDSSKSCYYKASCIEEHCGGMCDQDEGYIQEIGDTKIWRGIEYGDNWTPLHPPADKYECFDLKCKDGWKGANGSDVDRYGDVACYNEEPCEYFDLYGALTDCESQYMDTCEENGTTSYCNNLATCVGKAYANYYSKCTKNCNMCSSTAWAYENNSSCTGGSCQTTVRETCSAICEVAVETCPSGYYEVNKNNYPHLTFSTEPLVLSNGKVCYQPTGCNELKGYYADADDVDITYFSRTSITDLGKICYYAVGCNTENMATTDCYTATNAITHISGNVQCTESIYHLCSTSYFHYYEENLAGSVISRAFDYTPQTINGKTCYHADGCKTGYTENESERKAGGSCYTYGQLTCYESNETPDCDNANGYYSTSPNTSFFTASSSGSCYKATGCNTSAGAFSDASSVAVFFSMVSSTASGTTCYRATGCNSSSKANTTPPNSAIFKYEHSVRSGISCYRATGCKDGYTTTDNGTTPSQYGYIKCYKNQTNCPRSTTEYCLYSAAVAANCPTPSGTELGGGWGGMCTITTNCDGTTSCRVIECNRYLYNNILLLDNANNPTYAGIGENGNLLACGWLMATEYTSGADGYETWVDSKGGAGTDWMDYCCKNCSHAGATIPRIEDINESYRGYIDTDKCEARKIYMSTGEEVWHMLLK